MKRFHVAVFGITKQNTRKVGMKSVVSHHLPFCQSSPTRQPLLSQVHFSRSFSTERIEVTHVPADGPTGDLFEANKEIGKSLIGKTASTKQIFGPRSNAQAMLTCGGEALAAHASFDPDYVRAQGWIRHHAVGPAVLSPILISGLTGALVEAAFPQAVPVSQSMKQVRPLIVGVGVIASIEVIEVLDNRIQTVPAKEERSCDSDQYDRRHGYQVNLKTKVARVRDDAIIADGTHSIWIPDYQHM